MAAPRAYWKGYLKLSLVTCPVALIRFKPVGEDDQRLITHGAQRQRPGDYGGLDERGAGRSQRQKHYDAWPNRSPPFDC